MGKLIRFWGQEKRLSRRKRLQWNRVFFLLGMVLIGSTYQLLKSHWALPTLWTDMYSQNPVKMASRDLPNSETVTLNSEHQKSSLEMEGSTLDPQVTESMDKLTSSAIAVKKNLNAPRRIVNNYTPVIPVTPRRKRKNYTLTTGKQIVKNYTPTTFSRNVQNPTLTTPKRIENYMIIPKATVKNNDTMTNRKTVEKKLLDTPKRIVEHTPGTPKGIVENTPTILKRIIEKTADPSPLTKMVEQTTPTIPKRITENTPIGSKRVMENNTLTIPNRLLENTPTDSRREVETNTPITPKRILEKEIPTALKRGVETKTPTTPKRLLEKETTTALKRGVETNTSTTKRLMDNTPTSPKRAVAKKTLAIPTANNLERREVENAPTAHQTMKTSIIVPSTTVKNDTSGLDIVNTPTRARALTSRASSTRVMMQSTSAVTLRVGVYNSTPSAMEINPSTTQIRYYVLVEPVSTGPASIYPSTNMNPSLDMTSPSSLPPAPKLLELHPKAEYPPDLFSVEERRKGWVILHIFGMMYVFVALAIVCDEYFVPALGVITNKLQISEDVAGATFMAAGGSAPELFTSLIGVFISHSNVGIGTIVGSAVFNILFVIGTCALFSREILNLTWWPLFRDVSFYIFDLMMLILFFLDSLITWWESLMLLMAYGFYVFTMKWNRQLEVWVKEQLNKRTMAKIMVATGLSKTGNGDITVDDLEDSRKLKLPSILTRGSGAASLHNSTIRSTIYQLMLHTLDPLGEEEEPAEPDELPAVKVSPASAVDTAKDHDEPTPDGQENSTAGADDKGEDEIEDDVLGEDEDNIEDEAGGPEEAENQAVENNEDNGLGEDEPQGQAKYETQGESEGEAHGEDRGETLSKNEAETQGNNDAEIEEEGESQGQDAEEGDKKDEEDHGGELTGEGAETDGEGGEEGEGESTRGGEKEGIEEGEEGGGEDKEDGKGGEDGGEEEGGECEEDGKGEEDGEDEEEGEEDDDDSEEEDEEEDEDEEESEEPLSLEWPETMGKQAIYLFLLPIVFPLWLTVPDVRKPESKKFFAITFLGSILWIAMFSYLMVWWAHQVGETIGISEEIMGLTILAAGTSIPDLITSVIVARKGLGDMAVSSSVGSNIFDITVGLPVPWFLFSLFNELQPVPVSSNGLFCAIVLLFLMLLFVISSIASCKWRMNKILGFTMFLLYFIFLIVSVMLEDRIISCPISV